MVGQCLNLYENHYVQGKLFFCIDGSKFFINFGESVKVGVFLEERMPSGQWHNNPWGVSGGNNNMLTMYNRPPEDSGGSWYDYNDLSPLLLNLRREKMVKLGGNVELDSAAKTLMSIVDTMPHSSNISEQIIVPRGPGNSLSSGACQMTPISNAVADVCNKTKKRKSDCNFQNITTLQGGSGGRSTGRPTTAVEKENCVKTKNDFPSHNSRKAATTTAAIMDVFDDGSSYPQTQTVGDSFSSVNKIANKESSFHGSDNISDSRALNAGTTVFHHGNKVKEGVASSSSSTPGNSVTAPHLCKDCKVHFDSREAFKAHRKVKATQLKCDECLEIFSYHAYLQVHKMSHHGPTGPSIMFKDNCYWYPCKTCGELVKSLTDLQSHNRVHTGENNFECCVCHERFMEKSKMQEHIAKVHKSIGRKECRVCNIVFPDATALGKHKVTCRELVCHFCNNTFPNQTSRNLHYKTVHPNDIIKCELCIRMFSSRDEFATHMENHSKFRKEQCPICGLYFSRVKKHMISHKDISDANEDEIFYCDKCPKKFLKRSTFLMHQKVHNEEKLYQCPDCPKAFATAGRLRQHVARCKPAPSVPDSW